MYARVCEYVCVCVCDCVHGYIYVQAENTGKNPIPRQKNIAKNSINPSQCDGPVIVMS